MNINKPFRIINHENEYATISPLDNGCFTVVFDVDNGHKFIYTKENVESAIAQGLWKKLPEQEEALPRTFKFKCKGWSYEYEYTQDKGYRYMNNGVYDEYYPYHQDKVVENIKNGDWIVLPSEPEKKPIDTLQLKIEIDGVKEAYEILEDMVSTSVKISNTTLERIKSFTTGTGHDVFISEGIYKVYRKHEDMPYVCHTDEQVAAVMGALITLDGVEVG